MGEGPRSDRLGREELEALQQKALREWRDSDWLARHRPRAWTSLPDDGLVRVDLGAGIGEYEQAPGMIALDRRTGSRTDLIARSGERRLADLVWELEHGLPFEDQTVDVFHARRLLRDLPEPVFSDILPRELARTLRTTGTVELEDDAATLQPMLSRLVDHGLTVEDNVPPSDEDHNTVRVKLRKTTSHTTDAPGLVREHVYGSLTIREPRQPTPS